MTPDKSEPTVVGCTLNIAGRESHALHVVFGGGMSIVGTQRTFQSLPFLFATASTFRQTSDFPVEWGKRDCCEKWPPPSVAMLAQLLPRGPFSLAHVLPR